LKLRLEAILLKERVIAESGYADVPTQSQFGYVDSSNTGEFFIKNDRMYKHNIFRINYTTYDVRRDQDVVNPNTSHKDIMVLARTDSSDHAFLYARVLGIYHVNAIYTGPGILDYRPRRLEFLWVRWFEVVDGNPAGWNAQRLDTVRFLPMESEDAFGFVDPADVLRGCHLIPKFSHGRLHPDSASMSPCAKDSRDWKYYAVNR
jgi:hypothetical protein